MPRILWISPLSTGMYDEGTTKIINEVKRPDVEFRVVHLSKGSWRDTTRLNGRFKGFIQSQLPMRYTVIISEGKRFRPSLRA